MTNYESAVQESSGIDLDRRDVRALTEHMTVCEHVGRARRADDLYLVVSQSGYEYLVDVRQGRCECPDAEHNLPTEDGRQTCKHVAAVTFTTGMRPLPAGTDRDAINPQLVRAEHVDGHPTITAAGVATDGGELLEDVDEDDGRPR